MNSFLKITTIDKFDYNVKVVLLRLDINSPLDPVTKKIVNENKIKKSLETIGYLLAKNAKLVLIAHQGDTLDYHNLISLNEHAEKLSRFLGIQVNYIDDVGGPASQEAIKALKSGEVILLGNLKYLTEEVSTFENVVKLKPEEMLNTYLVRNLAPLIDYYVNDSFAAAHRNAPSMVAFQEILPAAGGRLLIKEINALNKIMKNPKKPSVFVLGGAKISDSFGMMKRVLKNGIADKILTCGMIGEVMLLASGIKMGNKKEKFIKNKGLNIFIKPATGYLSNYPNKIEIPIDLAYEKNGKRKEILVRKLPIEEMFMDIGQKTIEHYKSIILNSGTIFINGPMGVYEKKQFEKGTKRILKTIASAKGFSVIGGGDTVSAASKFINLNKINYISTAGGAMIKYLSGEELPLIKAMEKAYNIKNNKKMKNNY